MDNTGTVVATATLAEAIELYKSQVVARRNCETECEKWHKAFGDMMQNYRMENGVTAALAQRRMNISRSYLRMLESGQRRWSEVLIRKYFAAVKGGVRAA